MSFVVPEPSAELDLAHLWELYFLAPAPAPPWQAVIPHPAALFLLSGSHHLPFSPSCAADGWIQRKQLDSIIALWLEPFSWKTDNLHCH